MRQVGQCMCVTRGPLQECALRHDVEEELGVIKAREAAALKV